MIFSKGNLDLSNIKAVAMLLVVLLVGCDNSTNTVIYEPDEEVDNGGVQEEPASLSGAYEGTFKIGVALNSSQVYGNQPEAIPLINKHFNSATPENLLKWTSIHPQPNQYTFDGPDTFVEFAEQRDMFIVGHTLVWHSQIPDWTFVDENGDELGREALLQRMKDHIDTVVGRYKGRVDAWDVVNEAATWSDGLRQSKWLEIIGEDYLDKAFQYAHEADPGAELYYNDYNLWASGKRQTVVDMVKRLQENNIPIHGIGMQAHYGINGPSIEEIEASILAFSELGVKVMITELDVNVLPSENEVDVDYDPDSGEPVPSELNPFTNGLPDYMQQILKDRYVELFELFKKQQDKIDRVTLWGLDDGNTWLNGFPIPNRTNHPLLFDRNYEPKPALFGILEVAED
ncbi:endo-1,4-beta-xylanase [Rhodohalobacter sp. 8-1]|uniref:endo-1,4-beta-xylanase n=1 Tax=Rhodohalobacter sp. 8-1 TaxID=3131972 RepID=UPI0030EEE7D1